MKIFDNKSVPELTDKKVGKSEAKESKGPSKSGSKKSKIKPERENVSDAEIRAKLAHNVDLTNSAKQKIVKPNTQKLGDGFMANSEVLDQKKVELQKLNAESELKKNNVEAKSEVEKTEEVEKSKSDVGLNNPNDPTTKEKLKDVIGKGAFNFNGRERDILEKILMKD